jgi:hypothetical protein
VGFPILGDENHRLSPAILLYGTRAMIAPDFARSIIKTGERVSRFMKHPG